MPDSRFGHPASKFAGVGHGAVEYAHPITHPDRSIMTSVLITAFEPYGARPENASWLALMELTRTLPEGPRITTRRYPVDFAAVRQHLAKDLSADYDFAIHLGQSPGIAHVQLEAFGLNVGGDSSQLPERHGPLISGGPIAYQTNLPLADWAAGLRAQGIPTQVSHHAGTYLCNATLYWSCYYAEQMALKTRSLFVHLPLDVSQIVDEPKQLASLPTSLSARAVRLLLGELAMLPAEIA